jgi:hypothetical protein
VKSFACSACIALFDKVDRTHATWSPTHSPCGLPLKICPWFLIDSMNKQVEVQPKIIPFMKSWECKPFSLVGLQMNSIGIL